MVRPSHDRVSARLALNEVAGGNRELVTRVPAAMAIPPFSAFFQALWGYEPFPWQAALAERVVAGSWPSVLDLPTASGKTACIEIALYALAGQVDRPTSQRTAPRRIWFVVDRRIVVDEAFARAERIATRLMEATTGPLKEIADRLRAVGGTERPVATARLRGGILRDDGWARLPSQPAVITSTVDQVGSRLLFRGYGQGLLAAPIYAGLAANDSLILLDEAHCSVPFQQTLCAIQRFRGQPWAEEPLETPFAFVVLSATPPAGVPTDDVFPGSKREALLDHSALHRRFRASKPAELVVVKAKRSISDPLVAEAVERAFRFVGDGKKRVAVMVNRVRTAHNIASELESRLGENADVILLTGRLRPFDRDGLLERCARFLDAAAPEPVEKPIVVVSTQCLEVGADFSFDALVTEMASLDALRQRFGRLDRMGAAGSSPAVILVRQADTDPKRAKPDPIYGLAIANTWQLLSERATDGFIDFGVEQIGSIIETIEDITPYLAPAGEAPVLLPAHLDLLCQTAPPAVPEPEIQLFLHGKDRGGPEVQVVWRTDLDPRQPGAVWLETVALCPPVSGEMLSVPLHQLRAFLAGDGANGEDGDVEGVPGTADPAPAAAGRPFLLWRGRDHSTRERDPRRITPGSIVVLPASYGIGALGQPPVEEGAGLERLDLWERVLGPAGKPPAIRLTRAVLAAWAACPPVAELLEVVEQPEPDREQIDAAIDAVLEYRQAGEEAPSGPPTWWCTLLGRARNGRMEAHPAGGVVLFARTTSSLSEEPDLFADDDDLASAAGTEVSHSAHAALVRRTAGRLARSCLGEHFAPVLEAAADWHDTGKLDERFQVLLHEGDELSALLAPEPLAKSASIPSSPARRRAIREAAGLPEAFRHEFLSLQLAERFASLQLAADQRDLLLHLIASHHGHARPFAPVVLDPDPPAVAGQCAGVAFELNKAERSKLVTPHRLDSGVPERFWRLVRRYGWWGLAYLEAVFRLSDWYASHWIAVPLPTLQPVGAGNEEA